MNPFPMFIVVLLSIPFAAFNPVFAFVFVYASQQVSRLQDDTMLIWVSMMILLLARIPVMWMIGGEK